MQKIEDFQFLSEDELLIAIGKSIYDQFDHWLPIDTSEAKRIATKWLEENRLAICHALISSKDRLEKLKDDDKNLISGIVDLLSTIIAGVPVVAVATLLAKRGLGSFCRST